MCKLLLTNLLAVAIISTVDESINSRHSRSYEESQAGAGAKKKISWSAKEDSADEKRCARYGMSCDDIILDVITISSWLSADETKRKKKKRRRVEIQQMD
ncbi:exopolygalacturonase-like [Dorcoceras hygrometricum]|uniref:Exopolygalacturonase-like n=1 Tax=Dorcoceras hygrometricum TaxID=472368 RepID=A0A2Z7C2Y7_9LAMI|nr:exopolygalacturonase-like [Dorcoceras hygrometricum]